MTPGTRGLRLRRGEQMQVVIGRAARPARQRRHPITTIRDTVAVIQQCALGCGIGGVWNRWNRLATGR